MLRPYGLPLMPMAERVARDAGPVVPLEAWRGSGGRRGGCVPGRGRLRSRGNRARRAGGDGADRRARTPRDSSARLRLSRPCGAATRGAPGRRGGGAEFPGGRTAAGAANPVETRRGAACRAPTVGPPLLRQLLRRDLDLDLPRLRLLCLRKRHGQNAVLVGRLDVARVDRRGQGEAALEGAIGPLVAVHPLGALLGDLLLRTLDREDVVLQ